MSKTRTFMKSLLATFVWLSMLAAVGNADAQPFAYISNQNSNTVSVINTATNTVVATVAVGSSPAGVAVNASGTRVYVVNQNDATVSVIDTSNNTVTGTVTVGNLPFAIAVNPTLARAYVANRLSNTISVIDTTNNTLATTVTVGTYPYGVAFNPAGTRAYVTNSSDNTVSVIDTSNNTVIAPPVTVGTGPYGIAVNPAGTRVYVTNVSSSNLSVIDTSTNTVIGTPVAVGTGPNGVAINSSGTRAYVANQASGNVTVINTSVEPNTFVTSIPVAAAFGVAVNTRVYVTSLSGNSVSVIDASTNAVLTTVPVGLVPFTFGLFIGPATVPGVPTIGTATAGNASATVTYTPPAFDGGSPIATYTATSNPGGIQGFATGGPIVVNGLTNGTAYTFTVTATNGVGVGPPSAPSNSVTPAAALVACQFIPASGSWIVPANWSNCAGGNGTPAGTPGTANRADISGKTAILPTGTLNVGEINLSGAAVIQGTGLATSTLNVVAVGATPWGTGSYTFQNMTVVFTGSFPVDAFNGLLSVNNSVLVVSAPSSGMAASAVTITGTGARITNGGVFLLYTSLTMTAGGVFENNSGASFSPQAPITINGTFVNQGAFVTQAGFPITLANAAAFSQPAASGFIVGDGIISAIGQVLTVANGLIVGTATFNVGTLGNTGAVVAPTGLGMIGTITVNGNYVSGPAASVNIKIAAGMPSPVSDQLVVSGTSTLTNGTANFAYIDAGFGPYVPVQGNTFNFITAGAVAGTFSSFTFPPSGNAVSLTYTPTVVQFVVGAPVAPAITVTGTTTFPSTVVGASSGVQAITITNSGTGTLTLNSITHSNASVFPDTRGGPAPNATHYCGFGSLAGGVPNTGAPINIAPAASCVLNLIFSPNAVGALNGSITINSNAPTSPTAIALSGTGLPPLSTITPASALFGNTPVSLGVNQTGTFGNPSVAPYTITSLLAAGLGFSVVPSGASPCSVGAIVAGGGSCTYTVTFTATGPGNSNGTVTVGFQPFGAGPSYNATQNTSGNGFIPPSTNAPASINFGNVPITLTVTQNFTFTNTSNTTMFPAPYTLASIVTGGLGFSAVGSGATPCAVSLVLAPGTNCTMTVSFQIGGTGSSNGTTTIGYQAGFGANPIFSAGVSLVGNGILMPSSLAPTNAAFGNVPVGTPVTQAFTFTNDSNTIPFPSTYTITSFTTSGLGFTAVGSGGTPCAVNLTLAPGASCGATVTFLILVTGASNGTTTIGFLAGLGSNPAYSQVFASSGNGVPAGTTPSMTVAFAPATVAVNTNASMTLTLTNPGGTPAFISGGSIGIPLGLVATPPGANTCGTFGTVNANIYSFGMGNIPAMGSCTIVLTVQGPTAGGYTATVTPGTLNAGGANTNTSAATLTVTAAAVGPTPLVSLIPGALAFGARTLSTTSPPSTVALGNSGTALLTIISITASGDYAFTTSCPLAPSTLAVGIACPINVTFTPLAVGARPGSITIVSNAPGSPHTIGLSGTGTGGAVPNVSLAPAALAFGTQTVNTASALRSVVVSNTGFANLLISSIGISAPFSRVPLGAVVPPDCGGSVAPGNSCQIGVIFSPASSGAVIGQISIIDNATGSPRTVGLSGTGVAVPVAVISASAVLAFGDQVINSAASVQNLIISNTGTATLNISAITLTGTNAANFTLTGQSGCVSVAPGGNCTLPVTFATTTVGARTAQVNITSNAQNAALVNTVSLTGNGILAPRPVVNVTATAIGYGNVIFGGATPNQIVTLTNSGGQAMNIPSIVVTGDFMQMNNCGSGLVSLASCTISIVFAPLGQGTRFGELILTSSATSSPDRIQLSGTGCRWFSQAQSRLFLTSCGP